MATIPKRVEQFIAVISDKHRLQLLHALQKSNLTYTELCNAADLPSNACAYHVNELKQAKLVRTQVKHSTTYYVLKQTLYKKNVLALQRFLTLV